jgi:hypothetical protein
MESGPPSRGRWLILLVVGLLAGAAFTYLVLPRRPPVAVIVGSTGVDTTVVATTTDLDSSMCQRVFDAADGINTYLTDRLEADPSTDAHPLIGVSEEDRDAVWSEYLASTAEYQAETLAGFSETFAGEAQFLVERLSAAGAWEQSVDVVVVNELAIRNLAVELVAAALRADCVR